VHRWIAFVVFSLALTACVDERYTPRTAHEAVIAHVYETVTPHDLRITGGGSDDDAQSLFLASDRGVRLFMKCSQREVTICPRRRRGGDAAYRCHEETRYSCEDLDCSEEPGSCARLVTAADRQDREDVTYVREPIASGPGKHAPSLDCLGVSPCDDATRRSTSPSL
jgi:hypothetical protein